MTKEAWPIHLIKTHMLPKLGMLKYRIGRSYWSWHPEPCIEVLVWQDAVDQAEKSHNFQKEAIIEPKATEHFTRWSEARKGKESVDYLTAMPRSGFSWFKLSPNHPFSLAVHRIVKTIFATPTRWQQRFARLGLMKKASPELWVGHVRRYEGGSHLNHHQHLHQ